jgi:phosphodiesterase/alkaline phosphatase D-like protein
MVSSPSKYIQAAFAASVVIFLAFLFHLMPIGAEEIDEEEFNFVAAGDWGCGHEAIQTFSMMKSMQPELYLGLGDYSYQKSIDCWLNIVKSAGKAFKISLGNHDTEGKLLQAYMDEFKLDKQ